MTINHLFVHVSYARFAAMRKFYSSVLKPLGYTEVMHLREDLVAFGSDFFILLAEENGGWSEACADSCCVRCA